MSSQIPRILYGTAWKKERTTDLVVKAVLNGFRGIDTACQPKHYREELVGEALSILSAEHDIPRTSIYVQTKFTSLDGQDLSKPIPYDAQAEVETQVDQSIQKSLSQLGVEWIDCLVMHSPLRTKEQTLRAYRQLEHHHSLGILKSLGISNIYSPSLLNWLIGQSKVPLSVVQNRWFEGNDWDWDILEICNKNGIRYQSFWTLSGNPTLLAHPYLNELARKYELTLEQTLYAFCIAIGITPLSGTTSESHMKHDVAIANEFKGFQEDETRTLLRLIKQAMSREEGSKSRRRLGKLRPEETPLMIPEEESIRNRLLENITQQHTLTTQLFDTLSNSLSSSRRIHPGSNLTLEDVPAMYNKLRGLTEEQANLIELVRRHQAKWDRLQKRRRKKERLEENVREVLWGLEQARRDLEETIEKGKEVERGIDMAQNGALSTDALLHFATRLAPYTSRTSNLDRGSNPETTLPRQEVYYPIERLMMGSKLMRLARGEVMGAGEVGDREMIGAEQEQVEIPSAIQEDTRVVSAEAQAETVPAPQPVKFKPIKLDLSDDEDDEDMD